VAEVVARNHTKQLASFQSDDLLIHTGVRPCRVLISLARALIAGVPLGLAIGNTRLVWIPHAICGHGIVPRRWRYDLGKLLTNHAVLIAATISTILRRRPRSTDVLRATKRLSGWPSQIVVYDLAETESEVSADVNCGHNLQHRKLSDRRQGVRRQR
jgi:hypothetical protein